MIKNAGSSRSRTTSTPSRHSPLQPLSNAKSTTITRSYRLLLSVSCGLVILSSLPLSVVQAQPPLPGFGEVGGGGDGDDVLQQPFFNQTQSQQSQSQQSPPQDQEQQMFCVDDIHYISTSKETYTIGVYAKNGREAVLKELHPTFGTYLSATAGKRFHPPIQFETVAVEIADAFDTYTSGAIDFLFGNPSVFSCMESEMGASAMVSLINQRTVHGQTFNLTEFGGVIFTKADNDEIHTLQDIRNKKVGCLSTASLGAGLMQFALLQEVGIHYMQDVQQLLFMKSQGNVVNGVLEGQIDVGFVRTDQLERTIDKSTGELVDLNHVKIISPQTGLYNDGVKFPFQCSTPLYPEWPVANFPHVDSLVVREVQTALLALADHGQVGYAMQGCIEFNGCNRLDDDDPTKYQCQLDCYNDIPASMIQRCDTTMEIALLSYTALKKAKHAGWKTALSYIRLRDTQESASFISWDEERGVKACARLSGVEDAVFCPDGHFKKKTNDIINGCANLGYDCYDYQCICSPCIKAYQVDFLPKVVKEEAVAVDSQYKGCSKFAICGEVQQTKSIDFVAVDNMKRTNVVFTIRLTSNDDTVRQYRMDRVVASDGNEDEDDASTVFEYQWSYNVGNIEVGMLIVEVLVNDEQIPESPFRLRIVPVDCDDSSIDGGGSKASNRHRVPDLIGNCICQSNAIEFGNECVPLSILLPSIILPIVLALVVLGYMYVNHKRKQSDSVWVVQPNELKFDEPPRILGRGSFGMVLLADYRGTSVAVKRVLPPKSALAKGTKSSSGSHSGGGGGGTGSVVVGVGGGSTKAKLSSKNTSFFDFRDDEDIDDVEHGNVGTQSSSVLPIGSQRSGGGGIISGSTLGWILGGGSRTSSASQLNKLKQEFIKEMRLVSKLRHPCITTVMGAVIASKMEPMMVMECMEMGSLYDLLHNMTMTIEGEMILPILRDLSQGMRFLHDATPQIVHGDLKAQNVLVDSKLRAKVADFGLSQKGFLSKSVSGTPFWMAPELLRRESSNTPASDIYAFGVLLYEVFTRQEPYKGEDPKEVLQLVANKKVNKRPPVPDSCPPQTADLMKACFKEDPQTRPTSEEVVALLNILEAESVQPGATIQSLQRRKSSLRGQVRRGASFLFEIFPSNIAEAIRDGKKIEPTKHDCVTIYFSDIVSYTTIASKLDPEKAASLLDRLYTEFDYLCNLHKVFKVETVGDAYMAATNLDIEQPDHASIMSRFASDAIKAAAATLIDEEDPSLGYVQIRVGLHSGPVVTHVVGTRNQRFSVIGDTVNTASRMESNSKAGRIQCSEWTAKLIQDDTAKKAMASPNVDNNSNPISFLDHEEEVRVICRGPIEIKGKGEMTTYWVKVGDEESTSMEFTGHTRRSRSTSMDSGFEVIAEEEEEETEQEDDEHHFNAAAGGGDTSSHLVVEDTTKTAMTLAGTAILPATGPLMNGYANSPINDENGTPAADLIQLSSNDDLEGTRPPAKEDDAHSPSSINRGDNMTEGLDTLYGGEDERDGTEVVKMQNEPSPSLQQPGFHFQPSSTLLTATSKRQPRNWYKPYVAEECHPGE